jgi:hypothetical protein
MLYGIQCQPTYDVLSNTTRGLVLTARILEILNSIEADEYNRISLLVRQVSW